ncbi:GNAT family N-acetyltransferase [Pseudophaeobacter sp. EL27]|uniref:GNAT family N-acetyltransferase n=1 Tax=Pseudophaeobacter sp. EL27 TaxID=2107580 RepID=UPI000EFB79D7|nr:GNAT family N-acetyltransferase [Pseudophaeobacter sp. EL27]
MPLRLRPVGLQELDLVHHIQVEPDQTLYSGTVRQAFETAEDGVDFHAIFLQSKAIGFFKIDRAYGLAQADELGLRGFMIDRQHQKKRYATRALQVLPDYLHQHYPYQTGLVLTVDLQNLNALNLYRKNGFLDSGEMHFGGLFGLQRVMRMPFQITE